MATSPRKADYRQLSRIQRKLLRRKDYPLFDDAKLAEVFIARGAPLDVDQDDPIDFEPRFFLSGPVDQMERGLEDPVPEIERVEWYNFPPVQYHKIKDDDLDQLDLHSSDAIHNALCRGHFCERAAKGGSGWETSYHVSVRTMPGGRHLFSSPDDGRPRMNHFKSGEYYVWSGRPGTYDPHPDVPHTMATVYDMAEPKSAGQMLRSELLTALCLLKAQLRNTNLYLDHRVLPVLVLSFHGRFSARVVQAYYENRHVIIRPSRLMNMHTITPSPDARLAIRWLLCRPIGDTRRPVAPLPNEGDGAGPTEISTEQQQSAEQSVPARSVTAA